MLVPPAGSLLLHLLDWVRLHKADVDEKAREVLQSESPAEHHDYWDVVSAAHTNNYTFRISRPKVWSHSCHIFCVWPPQVVSYILQGRLEEARQMLVKQAALQPAARNVYKLMDSLLMRMPFYNVITFFCILKGNLLLTHVFISCNENELFKVEQYNCVIGADLFFTINWLAYKPDSGGFHLWIFFDRPLAWCHTDFDRVWCEMETLARGGGPLPAGQFLFQQQTPGGHLQSQWHLCSQKPQPNRLLITSHMQSILYMSCCILPQTCALLIVCL